MLDLTQIQQRILDFIRVCIQNQQRPPTLHEIAVHMGYRSDNSAYQHLHALQRKGAIRLEGRARGIRLLAPSGLAIIGRVAAGSPILAQQNIEDYVMVEASLFRPHADFLLRVEGMSMCNAGIMDGDLLAVHKTPVAEHNQIVVARLEDEVTVKRFQRQGERVLLLPENSKFKPIE